MSESGSLFSPPSSTPPGWYPDPTDSSQARYWDGSRWTGQSRPLPPPNPAANAAPPKASERVDGSVAIPSPRSDDAEAQPTPLKVLPWLIGALPAVMVLLLLMGVSLGAASVAFLVASCTFVVTDRIYLKRLGFTSKKQLESPILWGIFTVLLAVFAVPIYLFKRGRATETSLWPLGVYVVAVAFAALTAFATAPVELNMFKIETQIEDHLSDYAGTGALYRVECPETVDAHPGDKFLCEAFESGQPLGYVTVDVLNDEGDIQWDLGSLHRQ